MTVNGMEPDAKGNVVVDTPDLTELEGRVDGLADAVSEESRRAVGAEEELGGSIAAEASRAKAAEQGLRDDVSSAQTAIADRYTKRETDEKIAAATPSDYDAVKGRVAAVEAKVPAQASAQNQLADKAFVNSSIATNTAFYISDGGRPFQSLADLENYEGALTNNDYAFVVGRDAVGNTTYTRYKWNEATEAWGEEYVLNNSSFTAEQWATISSGITSGLVAKLGALPTAEALAAALAGMQARLVVQAGYAWRFSTESQGAGIEAFMEDADGYSVTSEAVDTGMRYSVAGYDTGLYLVPDTFVIGSPSSVHFFVYNASGTELYGRVSASYESVSEDVPPEVDPDPARGSGRLTTSGGVWSMIWGALAALPTGVASLYDWCVAQFAKYLPLTGGTLTGQLTIVPGFIKLVDSTGYATAFRCSGTGGDTYIESYDDNGELTGQTMIPLNLNNRNVALALLDWTAFPAAGELLTSNSSGDITPSGKRVTDKLDSTAAAPAWASGTAYTKDAIVTYNGVVYQNISGGTIKSATTPDTSGSGWAVKPVSSLFLPLSGGTLTGNLEFSSGFGLLLPGGWVVATDPVTGVLGFARTNPAQAAVMPSGKSGTIAFISDIPDVSGYAAKAPNPTAGHLAALDANGNPTDSGWTADSLARYAHVTKTLDNGAATLDDLAINAVGLPSGTTSVTLTLPAAVPGRVRDFIVHLTLAAAASVSFSSAAGEAVTWDSSGDPSGTFQAGTHLLSFTEVAPGVFRWGKPQADLTGQAFDFSTTQGVMDALAAVVTVLGGSVLNKPSAT